MNVGHDHCFLDYISLLLFLFHKTCFFVCVLFQISGDQQTHFFNISSKFDS